jgi:hypothetical protein
MTDGTLPFSKTDYDKLHRAVFPTIRRRDKYGDVGDVNTITHGQRGDRDVIGTAEIIAKETATLDDLRGPFLRFDTQSDTDDEAVTSINKFYRDPIGEDEPLTLYWSRWTHRQKTENSTLEEFQP